MYNFTFFSPVYINEKMAHLLHAYQGPYNINQFTTVLITLLFFQKTSQPQSQASAISASSNIHTQIQLQRRQQQQQQFKQIFVTLQIFFPSKRNALRPLRSRSLPESSSQNSTKIQLRISVTLIVEYHIQVYKIMWPLF